jgi:hypothetical protein
MKYLLSEKSLYAIYRDFNYIARKMDTFQKRGLKVLLRECLLLKVNISKNRTKFHKPNNVLDIIPKALGAIKFAVATDASANS